jgi:hypothetical protein
MFHTLYTNLGRTACYRSLGPEGEQHPLTVIAHIGQGHYQVSCIREDDLTSTYACALNYHPDEGGLEARTNLYYAETPDRGVSWYGPAGHSLSLPLREIDNPALLRNYADDGWLVYMKDIQFDIDGNPVILFIKSRGNLPGPGSDPRIWTVARRTCSGEWVYSEITRSDSNYDMGSLDLSDPDQWRLVAPTETGPQPGNPGGEAAAWTSRDKGVHWEKTLQLTPNSRYNHTYIRRTAGMGEQFCFFWANGNPRKPSPSSLYFTDRSCSGVWKLPEEMDGETAVPERTV